MIFVTPSWSSEYEWSTPVATSSPLGAGTTTTAFPGDAGVSPPDAATGDADEDGSDEPDVCVGVIKS